MVAARAMANKMARGCYYVLRDQVPFDVSAHSVDGKSRDGIPLVVLEKTKRLSGPIPACAASRGPRDQAMSHLWLAPLLAALTSVPHGHGLEIPMAFWSATRAKGTSQGSDASIPMGAGHHKTRPSCHPDRANASPFPVIPTDESP